MAAPLVLACQRSGEADPEVFLTEEASDLGVDFEHSNGMLGDLHFHELIGSGAALADLDGDGDLDLFLVQSGLFDERRAPGAPDVVFWNRLETGSLRFERDDASAGFDTGPAYGMGVAAGDFDNNGRTDLFVSNFGPDQLWLQRGDGIFEEVGAEAGVDDNGWGMSAAVFDFDRDGWLDLFVSRYVDYRLATHAPCYGESGRRDYCGPRSYEPTTDLLYRNRGDGTFEDVTRSAGLTATGPGLGVAVADFDRDGWLDVYIANDQERNFLWRNLGGSRAEGDPWFVEEGLLSGTALSAVGQAQASMGVVAADFDRDGDEDLFMTHLLNESNTLYRNDGSGQFLDASQSAGVSVPSAGLTGFGVVASDLNLDGALDLVVVNGAVRVIEEQVRAGLKPALRQRNALLLGLPDRLGEFSDGSVSVSALQVPRVSRGLAAGDLDNDGDTDLVIVNNNDVVEVLVNQTANPLTDWVGVAVRERSGRSALGAVVELADHPPARVDVGGSFLSSGDPRRVFLTDSDSGAGAFELRARVTWVDGEVEVFDGLGLRRYNLLRRGRGASP